MNSFEETVELAVPLRTAYEQWDSHSSSPRPVTAHRRNELIAWPGGRVTFEYIDTHTTRLVLRADPDTTPAGILLRFKEFVESAPVTSPATRQYWRVERA
ncbi:hypothetical protein [Kutzneria chonburiensis]|uniref:Uncharacterized protein n=1 Tax=Kutzneria chonburiensis TaxID=1483604 RepID=A0ABV6MP45_9PSEU|nr:hypothetical protein [Kutzneria chonburiensis]